MKAVVINQFGGAEVLQLQEAAMPKAGRGEVLVRVHAVSVNPVDYKIRNGSMKFITGRKFPRILGVDVAGVVEQAEKNSAFRPGDKVFGMVSKNVGTYAEFLALDEKQLCLIPEGLSMTEASSMPLCTTTALQAFRKGNGISQGDRLLINGASGGVGSFAVQLAKALGYHVTAVCSGRNLKFVRSLGADKVIDYEVDDFTKTEDGYQLVFDAVAKRSFASCKRMLTKNGTYVSTLPNNNLFIYQALNFSRSKKACFIVTKSSGDDLRIVADFVSKGLVKAQIEKVYPLKDVNQAHQHIETERVRGKLVLSLVDQA